MFVRAGRGRAHRDMQTPHGQVLAVMFVVRCSKENASYRRENPARSMCTNNFSFHCKHGFHWQKETLKDRNVLRLLQWLAVAHKKIQVAPGVMFLFLFCKKTGPSSG